MSLTVEQSVEQSDSAIRQAFYSMKEGVEYLLNDFCFSEANRLRVAYGYYIIKDKQENKFSRKGDELFLNNQSIFDFDGKNSIALTFAAARADRQPFAFPIAICFCFALQHNGFEKLNKDTCEGKVVEIDGKKYKLTAV